MFSNETQDVIKRLSEIEAREKNATEGEWVRTGERGLTIVAFHGTSRKARCGTPICGMFPCTGSSIVDEHDAEFIIKAHTDVPDLAKALREVTRKLEITNRAVLLHFEWYGLPIDDLNCDYWQGLVTQAEDELARSDAGGNITDERS